MFYSQFLLSKTAPLGVVWTAGHCLKRLQKEQVCQMDISYAVDKILDDEVREVAHRILAFLLLGVVRIFSRKVEYVYQFSQQMLNKLSGIRAGADERAHFHSSSRRIILRIKETSISVPKRLELDAFEIESSEDQESAINKRPRHEHVLSISDSSRKIDSLCKDDNPISEPDTSPFTPPKDVLSPYRTASHSLPKLSWNTKLFCTSGDVIAHDELLFTGNSFFSSPEMFLRGNITEDDFLEPMVLNEDEDFHLNVRSSNQNNVEFCSGGHADQTSNLGETPYERASYVKNFTMDAPHDKGKGNEAKKIEMRNQKRLRPEEFILETETPTVVTPSSKEHATTRPRHKVMLDSTIIVSNRIYKKWLDETRNIKRLKKHVQYGSGALRDRKLSMAPSNIFSPMCNVLTDLDSLESKIRTYLEESSCCHENVVDEPISSSPTAPETPIHQEMNSNNGNGRENDSLETITRILIEEKVLKLWDLVAGKTRAECAKMLYNLLVLRCRGIIDVQQEEAYGDIYVSKKQTS